MAPVQQQFDEAAITREEWAWVEDLIKEVSREEERDLFAQKLFQWDLAVKQFRKLEQKRVVLGAPTKLDLQFHALCLHGLLTIGRALVIASRQFGVDEMARLRIKHDQIDAYVEELEQDFREWHHGFSEAELARVREAVFGAAA